jgi:hypothetical protein
VGVGRLPIESRTVPVTRKSSLKGRANWVDSTQLGRNWDAEGERSAEPSFNLCI